jgi:hypothetical protein
VTAYAVYHAYDGALDGRKVHLDRISWCGDRPLIGPGPITGRPTERRQPVPPPAVYDPQVPWWHADLWIEGAQVTVAGHVIELDPPRDPRRVRINQGPRGLRAWVDGCLIGQAPGLHPPELDTDGVIRTRSLTSHLSDETIFWLAPGEQQCWEWGGSGPLDVTLAIRGSARASAGSHEQHDHEPRRPLHARDPARPGRPRGDLRDGRGPGRAGHGPVRRRR